MSASSPSICLVRHGETLWSASGRHTGRTDLALTALGARQARALHRVLSGREYHLVLTSPLLRARDTCRLSGLEELAESDSDLQEWDYGSYEGRTTAEIHREQPEWFLWRDGAPCGESPAEVAHRADRVLERARASGGLTILFGHGHHLRMVASRWLELPSTAGAKFALDPASTSYLQRERGRPVIRSWNGTSHLEELS